MRPARRRWLQLRQGQEDAIISADPGPPRLPHAPGRLVSLVPAHTASLFDLGLGARLVGRTDACSYPVEGTARLPSVGDPARPEAAAILALQPDLVLAGAGLNAQEAIAALRASGVLVWVTADPRTVREALNLLWALVRLCDVPQAGHTLAALERSYEITRQAALDAPPSLVFCPLSRSTDGAGWLVAGRDSYLTDLLATCGGESVPAALSASPIATDDLSAAAPDVIVLPGSPGPFSEADVAALADRLDLPAVAAGRVYLMDGALLTWPGTHLARALAELPAVLHIPHA
ncbi:MAG: ABC transporter substrate-binding protein [Anaerolineales bacterium]|nr:ABC transporter substrate-binding protein [Anaerolineales bacterium]